MLVGFEEELGHLMCPSSSTEAFTFIVLWVKEFSSTAKELAAVGETWSAGICEEVERFSAQIRVGVTLMVITNAFLYVQVEGRT